jgi:hypothetical protein
LKDLDPQFHVLHSRAWRCAHYLKELGKKTNMGDGEKQKTAEVFPEGGWRQWRIKFIARGISDSSSNHEWYCRLSSGPWKKKGGGRGTDILHHWVSYEIARKRLRPRDHERCVSDLVDGKTSFSSAVLRDDLPLHRCYLAASTAIGLHLARIIFLRPNP